VLQQPSMGELLRQIQDAAKGIQTIQMDIVVVKSSVGVDTTSPNVANFSGYRTAARTWAQVATKAKGSVLPPPPAQQREHAHLQDLDNSHGIQGPSGHSQAEGSRHRPALSNGTGKVPHAHDLATNVETNPQLVGG
jgi:hypothetical protein